MMDPISIGLLAGTAASGAAMLAGKSGRAKNRQALPPTTTEGDTSGGRSRRKYRAPAQLFTDEDLRLGGAGKLGM